MHVLGVWIAVLQADVVKWLGTWVAREGRPGNPHVYTCGDAARCIEDASTECGTHAGLNVWSGSEAGLHTQEGLLLRVHAEVDAANGCFDHVCFLLPIDARAVVVDAYINLVPLPRMWHAPRKTRGGWLQLLRQLQQLQQLQQLHGRACGAPLSALWQEVFHIGTRPVFEDPVAAVCIHASWWRLGRPLPSLAGFAQVPWVDGGPVPSLEPIVRH